MIRSLITDLNPFYDNVLRKKLKIGVSKKY